MVEYKQLLKQWNKRMDRIAALRAKGLKLWEIGEREGISAERVRQLLKKRAKRNGTETGTIRVVPVPGAKTPGA